MVDLKREAEPDAVRLPVKVEVGVGVYPVDFVEDAGNFIVDIGDIATGHIDKELTVHSDTKPADRVSIGREGTPATPDRSNTLSVPPSYIHTPPTATLPSPPHLLRLRTVRCGAPPLWSGTADL